MKVESIKVVREFMKITSDCFARGWNERNGGNLTYRLTKEDVQQFAPLFEKEPHRVYELGVQLRNLADEYFLVTGSGKFFRNVALDFAHNCGVIQINAQGDAYQVVWGLLEGAMPTSELPSHLMSHSIKKVTTKGLHRVILHSHTTNTIALTFVLPLTTQVFTKAIWEMISECSIVFPTGIGVVEWMVPGSIEIGKKTGGMMEKHDVVIWAHHGMFCSGETLDLAFGLMDTVEKAAEILVKVISMGGKKQAITKAHLAAIEDAFHVGIDVRYME